MGLSVAVTRETEHAPKQQLGALSDPLSVVRAIGEARPFQARIRCDAEEASVSALQIGVANGRHYGGGMTALDDASIRDQRLVVWAIAPQPLWRLVADLPRYRTGRLRQMPGVRVLTGTHVVVEPDTPMDLDVDGEIHGRPPATFEVVPRALTLLAGVPA